MKVKFTLNVEITTPPPSLAGLGVTVTDAAGKVIVDVPADQVAVVEVGE